MASVVASGSDAFQTGAAETPGTDAVLTMDFSALPDTGYLIWAVAYAGEFVGGLDVTDWNGDGVAQTGWLFGSIDQNLASPPAVGYGVMTGLKVLDGLHPATYDITFTGIMDDDTPEIDYQTGTMTGYLVWAAFELGDGSETWVEARPPSGDFAWISPGTAGLIARITAYVTPPASGHIDSMTGYTIIQEEQPYEPYPEADSDPIPPAGPPPDPYYLQAGVAIATALNPGSSPTQWTGFDEEDVYVDAGADGFYATRTLITYDFGDNPDDGIPCTGCPDPIHIPHKRWMFTKDKAHHRENWLTASRWVAAARQPTRPDAFHPPLADMIGRDLDNWNALERWANAWVGECGCWTAELHIPHKITPTPKEEEENWLTFERWTQFCTCEAVEPPPEE